MRIVILAAGVISLPTPTLITSHYTLSGHNTVLSQSMSGHIVGNRTNKNILRDVERGRNENGDRMGDQGIPAGPNSKDDKAGVSTVEGEQAHVVEFRSYTRQVGSH